MLVTAAAGLLQHLKNTPKPGRVAPRFWKEKAPSELRRVVGGPGLERAFRSLTPPGRGCEWPQLRVLPGHGGGCCAQSWSATAAAMPPIPSPSLSPGLSMVEIPLPWAPCVSWSCLGPCRLFAALATLGVSSPQHRTGCGTRAEGAARRSCSPRVPGAQGGPGHPCSPPSYESA